MRNSNRIEEGCAPTLKSFLVHRPVLFSAKFAHTPSQETFADNCSLPRSSDGWIFHCQPIKNEQITVFQLGAAYGAAGESSPPARHLFLEITFTLLKFQVSYWRLQRYD